MYLWNIISYIKLMISNNIIYNNPTLLKKIIAFPLNNSLVTHNPNIKQLIYVISW